MGSFKISRQTHILKVVEERGQVTVREISELFDISDATVRRDLFEMDRQGKLRRMHGGAVTAVQALREPPVTLRCSEQSAEKQQIGRAAAQLLRPGETVFLGSGTTVTEMARRIPDSIKLTVISNSFPVLTELNTSPNIELIAIGGMLRKSEQSMVGHVAEQNLREFRADRVFMGIRSISPVHGFTNDDFPDTTFDRALFNITSQVIVLADHSKFGRISLMHVAPIQAARMIITDSATPKELVSQIESLGPRVLLV
jgi:DeoR/GlpR family transcriptional regulator of sugar metabolism